MTEPACTCDYGTVAVGLVEPPTADPDCPIHAVPSPLQPWTPLSDEDRLKVDEWLAEFAEAMPLTEAPEVFSKPVDWPAEIAKWERVIADLPPRRTEPIKLTPGQWAILPHGDPRIPRDGAIGDLMGVPVFMVEDESDSTPVVEGWLKPKRKPWWRRLGLKWWKREAR